MKLCVLGVGKECNYQLLDCTEESELMKNSEDLDIVENPQS
jgi:hypothetical protein